MLIVIGKRDYLYNVASVGRTIQVRVLNESGLKKLLAIEECENYVLKRGELEYTQGSEKNLPDIGQPALFILEKILDREKVQYRLLNTGNMSVGVLSLVETIKLNNKPGIVNAKTVQLDSKTIIASLGGTFKVREVSKNEEKTTNTEAHNMQSEQKSNKVDRILNSLDIENSSQIDISNKLDKVDTEELLETYKNNDTNKEKCEYIKKKSNGRLGGKIKKALTLGLAALALTGTLAGCGQSTETNGGGFLKEKQAIEQVDGQKGIEEAHLMYYNKTKDGIGVEITNMKGTMKSHLKITDDGLVDQNGNSIVSSKKIDNKTIEIEDTKNQEKLKLILESQKTGDIEVGIYKDNKKIGTLQSVAGNKRFRTRMSIVSKADKITESGRLDIYSDRQGGESSYFVENKIMSKENLTYTMGYAVSLLE